VAAAGADVRGWRGYQGVEQVPSPPVAGSARHIPALRTSDRGTNYLRGAIVNICDNGGTVNIGNGSSNTTVNGTLKSNTITTTATNGTLSVDNNGNMTSSSDRRLKQNEEVLIPSESLQKINSLIC
jgi:hypothetical protein